MASDAHIKWYPIDHLVAAMIAETDPAQVTGYIVIVGRRKGDPVLATNACCAAHALAEVGRGLVCDTPPCASGKPLFA